jgi:hypothetical protein
MDGSYVSDIRLMEKIILKYWRKHKWDSKLPIFILSIVQYHKEHNRSYICFRSQVRGWRLLLCCVR